MHRFLLRNHIYFCSKGDALIFLDLEADRYAKLQGEPVRALWRACLEEQNVPPAVDLGEPAPILLELERSGLLTTEPSLGKPLAPTEAQIPVTELLETDESNKVKFSLRHVVIFATACARAAMRLHSESIQRTVERVTERKSRSPQRPINGEEIASLVARFKQLRALFPVRYLCLFDSLALLEFLAHYRVFPDWVFAVKFDPWKAHCWVQAGEVLFNEEIEEADDYVPIMVV